MARSQIRKIRWRRVATWLAWALVLEGPRLWGAIRAYRRQPGPPTRLGVAKAAARLLRAYLRLRRLEPR
jgi:hypothetical protein